MRNTFAAYLKMEIMAKYLPAIAEEAQEWPLDKLTRYIMEHYHEGTVEQVKSLWTLAKQHMGKQGATDMHIIVRLLSESYDDLSNHFQKEETVLFPYIIELQGTINQGLEAQPFHCGSVQYPCHQMMMEHDSELERYDRIIGICRTFTEPFASSEECLLLTGFIEAFQQKLQEHIYLENENLFPRAIAAEGLNEKNII